MMFYITGPPNIWLLAAPLLSFFKLIRYWARMDFASAIVRDSDLLVGVQFWSWISPWRIRVSNEMANVSVGHGKDEVSVETVLNFPPLDCRQRCRSTLSKSEWYWVWIVQRRRCTILGVPGIVHLKLLGAWRPRPAIRRSRRASQSAPSKRRSTHGSSRWSRERQH